jgi:hypothetical protein
MNLSTTRTLLVLAGLLAAAGPACSEGWVEPEQSCDGNTAARSSSV